MLKTLFLSVWILFHPVHVTITSIDYIPEISSLKVFVRMYFDDFLRDCQLSGNDVQNIDFSVCNTSSMDAMEKYMKDKLLIKINAVQLSGRMKDISMLDNEISTNIEYPARKKPKTISVKNLILTGLYSDQSNLIIVRIKNFEEGFKLSPELTEKTYTIK
jgi:hypothetical protein